MKLIKSLVFLAALIAGSVSFAQDAPVGILYSGTGMAGMEKIANGVNGACLKSTGTSTKPSFQTCSGGLFSSLLSTTPTAASTGFTTWVNQGGTATRTDLSTGLGIFETTSQAGDQWRELVQSAPTAPYTITALIFYNSLSTGTSAAGGIGWRDSASGKIQLATLRFNSTNWQYAVVNYTNPTTFSGTAAGNFNSAPNYAWFKIRDDGTNVTFSISQDGAQWMQAYTVAKSSGFLGATGYNQLCYALDANGNNVFGTVLASYTVGP